MKMKEVRKALIRRSIVLFVASIILMFIVGSAIAIPITFTDTTIFKRSGTNPVEDLDDWGWGAVNKLNRRLDYVSWTHHFEFVPPASEVLSGNLTVYLRDDERDNRPWKWEYGFLLAEGGTWDLGEVDTGPYSYDVRASYLSDGEFRVNLVSLYGDFFIDKSDLEITYNPNPTPEPGTLLLLGSGLVGVAAYYRHRRKKTK